MIDQQALAMMKTAADANGSRCLVSYSGGKDSLACLDLACRTFEKVAAFHMYFVPGLKVIDDMIEFAKTRFRVEVLLYPHWSLWGHLRNGDYCPSTHYFDNMRSMRLSEMYKLIRHETGVQCIINGAKRSDMLARRARLYQWQKSDPNVILPLIHWMQSDVVSYLAARDLPCPIGYGKTAGGVGLEGKSICWLHDKHPEDFELLLKFFPFAGAVVKRRDWYGIETR